MVDVKTVEDIIEAIRIRTAEDRAEYAGTVVDRSVLDREFLLNQLDQRV